MKRALVVAVAGLMVPCGVAGAQGVGARFGVEAAGFQATLDGNDLDGIRSGMGFDLQGRFAWPVWSVGFGWQRSGHDVDGITDNLTMSALFFEPRYQFPPRGAVQPYVLLRGGWVQQKLDAELPGFGRFVAEASGWIMGGGGGVAFVVTPTIDFHVSAMWARLAFGDLDVDGQPAPDSDANGSTLILRAGVSLLLIGRHRQAGDATGHRSR